MVCGLAQTLSRDHGVVVRDNAIRSAVTLSHRYIPARQLPDKAISLLDTACAHVALSQHAAPRELDDVRQRLAAARVEESLLAQEARLGIESGKTLSQVRTRIDELATREVAVHKNGASRPKPRRGFSPRVKRCRLPSRVKALTTGASGSGSID